MNDLISILICMHSDMYYDKYLISLSFPPSKCLLFILQAYIINFYPLEFLILFRMSSLYSLEA